MTRRPRVDAWCDGGGKSTGGVGGWGVVLKSGDTTKEFSGALLDQTNQQMEIVAAVMALAALKVPCDVVLTSDSAYVINCMNDRWFEFWIVNQWFNRRGQRVKNREYWERLLEQRARHKVIWRHVKGHNGDANNERCDELATEAIEDAKAFDHPHNDLWQVEFDRKRLAVIGD